MMAKGVICEEEREKVAISRGWMGILKCVDWGMTKQAMRHAHHSMQHWASRKGDLIHAHWIVRIN